MKRPGSKKNEFIELMNDRVAIIAELSCNHLQDFDLAVKSVEAIAKTGADILKLQAYTPDTITLNCRNEHFQIKSGTTWDGMVLYDLYKEAFTPWDWFPKLQKIAKKLGMEFFASAFDQTAVDMLEDLSVSVHKIASFEVRDIPLVQYMAKTGKPLIISTGVADKADIELAVQAARDAGATDITLLKCTSEYPTPLESVNLAVMPQMAKDFGVRVGLSDHTLGFTVPIASVALGARVIEKHFILDKSLGGHDVKFSLDQAEFTQLVQKIREAETIMGKASYELTEKQKRSQALGRSLFVVKDVRKGEIFSNKNVRSIRPAVGLHPKELPYVLGKKATRDISLGTPLSQDLFT